jgi:hypothetical protein
MPGPEVRKETLVSRDLPDRLDLRVLADIKEIVVKLDLLDREVMFLDR